MVCAYVGNQMRKNHRTLSAAVFNLITAKVLDGATCKIADSRANSSASRRAKCKRGKKCNSFSCCRSSSIPKLPSSHPVIIPIVKQTPSSGPSSTFGSLRLSLSLADYSYPLRTFHEQILWLAFCFFDGRAIGRKIERASPRRMILIAGALKK